MTGLTPTPASPTVDEEVTFTATASDDCGVSYEFTIDGQPPPAGSTVAGNTLKTTFTAPGQYTVRVTATSNAPCSGSAFKEITVTVNRALAGRISVSPDPPVVNRSADLSATQTGGSAEYTYAWDTDDDGSFDDATTRTVTKVFPTTGPHDVSVRIRDGATPFHENVVTRTLDVVDSPAPGPTPEPEPPCVQNLTFGLSEFKTGGCFTRTSQTQYETTAAITLNGVSFPDFGQKFVITLPTTGEPGGHFSALDSAVKLGGLRVFSGDIDWTLPDGKQGDEEEVEALTLPPFAKLFGLDINGSTSMRIGWRDDGQHYAVFPINVDLPALFTPGPDRNAGRVTGEASVRVDDSGPHFDGLKIAVTDVFIGRIKVPEACFSYIPAGGQTVAPCDPPSLDGKPYITCADDATTERWDGNAVLELPVAGGPQFAAFGGLADGKLSKLGGFADNLGVSVALLPGVFLKRIGAGLCISPPPLKVRGDVGVEALGGKLRVNGHVLYTDESPGEPWSVEVGGNASIADTQIGEGTMTFNGWGDVDFDVSASLDLFGVASVEGQVAGWFQPRYDLFNVSGRVKGCIASVICAEASGVVSSSGIAGCIDAGSITVYEPAGSSTGPFGPGSTTVSLRKRVIQLKAGFGYRYGESVDLLGYSCDFSPYSATKVRPASVAGKTVWNGLARVAAATLTQRIAPRTKAATFRIHGTKGPPKVVVRGPGGTTIRSPGARRAKQVKGSYMLAENKTDGTTSVLLVNPAPGLWTITAAPGAKSKPTTVDRSDFAGPPAFAGSVRRSGGRQVFTMAYAAPRGATVSLVERGKGIARTLVEKVRGVPCKQRHTLSGGRKLLCAQVKFRPARGPGGKRWVQAVVTRGAIPFARTNVASFRAPRETLPSRPGALRATRIGGALVVAFPPASGASRYSVVAELSDGRRLGFDLGSKCRAVKISAVPDDVSANVKVAGVRYDLRTGKYRAVQLRAGRSSAGPAGLLPSKICT
ncbi:MAG: hypothetical protein QOD44_3120 [Solirubrobacteraceae bacterium]|nr:hypothetical protein [Solirubrobacteraceae bacterium]